MPAGARPRHPHRCAGGDHVLFLLRSDQAAAQVESGGPPEAVAALRPRSFRPLSPGAAAARTRPRRRGGLRPVGSHAEVDRTEASCAPARGGDRTRHRSAHPHRGTAGGVVRGTGALATALFGLLLAVSASGAPAAGASPSAPGPAHAVTTRSSDAPTLVHQSPWVGPRSPDQALTLGLRVRSAAARRDLALTVTVFDHVASRSAFDETLSGRGLGGWWRARPPSPCGRSPPTPRGSPRSPSRWWGTSAPVCRATGRRTCTAPRAAAPTCTPSR